MKRRDFIKGLVAAPVALKGVEAVAKPKSDQIVFGSVIEENPTIELTPDVLVVPKNLEDAAIEIMNMKDDRGLLINTPADMKGIFGWSNP